MAVSEIDEEAVKTVDAAIESVLINYCSDVLEKFLENQIWSTVTKSDTYIVNKN